MKIRTNYKIVIALILVVFTCRKVFAQLPKVHPVIIEFVVPKNTEFKFGPFSDLKDLGILEVKQWQDRVMVYATSWDLKKLTAVLKREYPHIPMIVFDKPFYDFERVYCDDKHVSKEWDNIILTANLVDNPKMQQEYLDYHKTQFEKWPEVSQGFCRAKFQQLLVFKNGRQLMLVISIPKGESLDRLNPLTTKNNPRVEDWNRIMKKYQEGLPGTKKGEVWVMFKKVPNNKFLDY